MLEDDHGRLGAEVLQNGDPGIHVREVDLAGVFAGLEKVLLGHARDQGLARSPEGHSAEVQPPPAQLVDGGRLIRILAVPQPLFRAVDGPGPFHETQLGVAQPQGHLPGKGVLGQGGVHLFQVAHVIFISITVAPTRAAYHSRLYRANCIWPAGPFLLDRIGPRALQASEPGGRAPIKEHGRGEGAFADGQTIGRL